MAVIRLEFDIDSDVHPELHAMLSSIVSAAARGERLRQLAATGLVWERVRILNEPLPEAPIGAAAVATAAAAAPVTARHISPDALAAVQRSKGRRSTPGHSHFVDLAIDAGASAAELPPPDPLALREFEDEIERAIRELPELFDDVAPDDLARPPAPLVRARPVPPPVSPMPSRMPMLADLDDLDGFADDPLQRTTLVTRTVPEPAAAYAPQVEVEARIDAEPEETVDDDDAPPPPLPPPPSKSGTRTRLMRMKERGLFKNE